MIKEAYIKYMKGHKNSKNEPASWVIIDHNTGKVLSSHKTKEEAKSHLRDMKIHGSFIGIRSIDQLFKFAGQIINLNNYYKKLEKIFIQKDITIDDLVKIYDSDPTTEVKEDYTFEEGYFTQWLNKELKENYEKLKSDAENDVLKVTLQTYLNYKDSQNFKDIESYNISSLEEIVLQIGNNDSVKYMLNTQELDYVHLFDSEELSIYEAFNLKASVYFGDIAYNEKYPYHRWCVTWPTEQGLYYFNTYSEKGNQHFFHLKKYDSWFAYFGNEFQDVDNDLSANLALVFLNLNDKNSKKEFLKVIPDSKILDSAVRAESSEAMLALSNFGIEPSLYTLHDCIRKQSVELVKTLLYLGVKPNEYTFNVSIEYTIGGNFPNIEIMDLLLKAGAKPDKNTMYLALKTQNLIVVEFIINAGVKPGKHSLAFALERDNIEIAKLLINAGAVPDTNALNYALNSGDKEIINSIIQMNPKPDGETLAQAIFTKDIEIVKAILQLGAQPTVGVVYTSQTLGKPEITNLLNTYLEQSKEKMVDDSEEIFNEPDENLAYAGINSLDNLFKIAAAPTISELYKIHVEKKKTYTKEQFEELINLDPTFQGNDTVGSYTLWLLKIFKDIPEKISEDGYKAEEYLTIFDKTKKYFSGNTKNIDTYNSLPELFEIVKSYRGMSDEEMESDSQLRRRIQKEKDNIDIVFENENWLVLTPNSYEASCYWGTNTEWCTATRTRRDHFDKYNRKGSLYIIINKHFPNDKWQYHIDEGIMDQDDDYIPRDKFLEMIKDPDFYDPKFYDFIEYDLQDIALNEYSEKESDARFELAYEMFENEYEEELDEYKPNYPKDLALDIMWEYGYFELDSNDWDFGDIYWDGIRRELKDRLQESNLEEDGYAKDNQLTFDFDKSASFKGIKSIDKLIKIAASLFKQLQQKYSEEDILFAMKNDPSYQQDLKNAQTLTEAKNIVNGKLGKFVQFILTHIEEIKNKYPNDMDNILNEYLILLNTKNINFNTPIEKFESVAQLKETIDSYAAQLNPIKNQKDFENQIRNLNPEETEKFEIGSEFVIIHPKTAAESAYWGSGTTWCTSKKTLEGNYFNAYTQDDQNFYIIIDKKTGEKYGYAEKTGELQDRTNNPMLKYLFTLDLLDRENGEEVLKKLYELTGKEEFAEREETTLYIRAVDEAEKNNRRNIDWYDKTPRRIYEAALSNNNYDPELAFQEVKRFWDTCVKNIDNTNNIVMSKIPENYRNQYFYKDITELSKKPETYEEHKQENQELLNLDITTLPGGNKFLRSFTPERQLYPPIFELPILPKNLTIGGHVELIDYPNISLPENLTIRGDLDLSNTLVHSLPEGLDVGRGLYLKNTQIQSLPKGLNIGGILNLENTPIQSLPEGLNVGSSLYLNNTPIQSLPEGLNVGGSLHLTDSQIQSLPANLSIGRDLHLRNTPIQSLPEGLLVSGSLHLTDSQIQSLPENLFVGGNLDLRNTPIQSLPEGLIVGNSLNIIYTSIKSLPERIDIGGVIYSSNNLQRQYDIIKQKKEQEVQMPEKDFTGKETVDDLIQEQEPEIQEEIVEEVEDNEELVEENRQIETSFRGANSINKLLGTMRNNV